MFIYIDKYVSGFFKYLFIYLAATSLSCSVWVPDQVLNPGTLYWECRVLATGLPERSLFFNSILLVYLYFFKLTLFCLNYCSLTYWVEILQLCSFLWLPYSWPCSCSYKFLNHLHNFHKKIYQNSCKDFHWDFIKSSDSGKN